MIKHLLRVIVFVLLASTSALSAQSLPVLRISVENTATHVQAIFVRRFSELLAERASTMLRVEFYHSAALYRDSDVIQALTRGRVEMAVPGTWILSSIIPNTGMFLLPMFYHRPRQVVDSAVESLGGKTLEQEIADTLDITIPGDWLDLGHAHIFSKTRPIRDYSDLQQLKIRVAGGMANEMRIAAMGAVPISIPWPDFPRSLAAGEVDAVLTTYETVASAELWKLGIQYVYEDKQYFPQYVPMIANSFWKKLKPELQNLIIECWQEVASQQKLAAEQAQNTAKQILIDNNVTIIVPGQRQIATMRAALLKSQPEMIQILGIDSQLVEEVQNETDFVQ